MGEEGVVPMKRSFGKILATSLLTSTLLLVPTARARACTYDQLLQGLCVLPNPVAPLLPAAQPKFLNELPQPIFYQPVANGAFDYYEIFSAEAGLGLAASLTPFGVNSLTPAVSSKLDTWGTLTTPVNKVWLGLVDPLVPATKLYTEVWGYGQQNNPAYPLNNVATYPAMSFRATKGTPVKVMWVNKLPNVHMFCKNPTESNYPCGIDRTLMGTKGVAPWSVGPYGGSQQPDNAMVVHLHGGEIPPDSDGFAELWFGNQTTAAAYSAPLPGALPDAYQNIDPHWAGTLGGIQPASPAPPTGTSWNNNGTQTGDPFAATLGSLIRPTGNAMIYNYPMVQDAATIWYHDHALGKTRVNVVAGPAGYFYVQDKEVEPFIWGNTSDGLNPCDPNVAAAKGVTCPGTTYAFGDCSNGGILAGACRDVPVVLQDRAFNADGSINFPNLLGQAAPKANPLTPGPNPLIHPQWVPEYFGDAAVVNGITWPKLSVKPQAYRIRFLDGSNARCYVLSLKVRLPPGAAANVPKALAFQIIAGDQGYLPAPSPAPIFTMCPGERYEAVIDFSPFPAGTVVSLVNTGGAPFPAGPTPQAANSPYMFLANMMQFTVGAGAATPAWTTPAAWAKVVGAPVNARIAGLTAAPAPNPNPNYFLLNEVLDPTTKAPLRVQIDGKAFEDAVTETPTRGATQYWDIVNTTVDAHPMHLHLVQFKVIGRWTLDMNRLNKALAAAGFLVPGATFNKAAVNPWNFIMAAVPPAPGEEGFKDTARANPGELLRIVAKWDAGWADQDPVALNIPHGEIAPLCEAPLATDLVNAGGCRCVQTVDAAGLPVCGATIYKPFYQPVSSGPYVWHCHIVDHEDNEMMRPSLVLPRI
jgi:FtsP/CotA-like multicopper oxidase with cupredoxin domain